MSFASSSLAIPVPVPISVPSKPFERVVLEVVCWSVFICVRSTIINMVNVVGVVIVLDM